ncbi:MAG: hypothetical protein OHK0021_23990 [Bryobacter sp.]
MRRLSRWGLLAACFHILLVVAVHLRISLTQKGLGLEWLQLYITLLPGSLFVVLAHDIYPSTTADLLGLTLGWALDIYLVYRIASAFDCRNLGNL